MARVTNLLEGLPVGRIPEEVTELLATGQGVRIERIVSTGHCSAEGFWYDQDEAEWVMVVQGDAELRFEGQADPVAMQAGDSVFIPAHTRHRVERTSDAEATVWLAVFLPAEPGT